MKKLISVIMVVTMALILFGCNNENSSKKSDSVLHSKGGHKIYIHEEYSKEIKAIFSSTTSEESETYILDKIKEYTFSVSADTNKFDRVQFIGDDTDKSMILAFNDYVNSYYLKAGSNQGNTGIPFVYDDYDKEINFKTVSLKYSDTEKKIFIWTPDDYDKTKKYSVIYMLDGQNMFYPYSTNYGCWNVAESVEAMMANSDNRCIIVGIDDGDGNRDSELTPDIGELAPGSGEEFQNGTGKIFSDFVVNKVMPYIEKNYSTDGNNSICGSSSGGIEAFYIGIEHNDKFNSIGALSPAFLLFNEDVWNNYLSKVELKNKPLVYIYNGQGDELENQLYTGAKDMIKYLDKISYPKDKVIFKEYKEAQHNEIFWRAIFPDYLKYTFPLDKTTLKD